MNKTTFIISLILAASATLAQVPISQVTEVPSGEKPLYQSTTPPEVVLAFTYVKELADEDPNDWAYVRENLDGLWLNFSGTGVDQSIQMAETITSKNYYFIAPIREVSYSEQGELLGYSYKLNSPEKFLGDATEPNLVIVNDYMTKQAINPLRYYGEGYVQEAKDYAESNYGDAGINPFGNRILITTRAGHFKSQAYNKTYDPAQDSIIGKAFSTMEDIGSPEKEGGFVYEISPIHFFEDDKQATYLQSYNRAHEMGAKAMYLAPRGHAGSPKTYTDALVTLYAWFKKTKAFPDVIVFANYSRTAADGDIDYLKMLPMINPVNPDLPAEGSITGAMYWALQQRENEIKKQEEPKVIASLADQGIGDKVLVYPTIGTGEYSLTKNVSWKLYSIQGKLFKEGKGNRFSIGNLQNGIYVLRTENSSSRIFLRK